MKDLQLMCKERKGSGTGYARSLRKEGRIPAVIYGFDKNYSISLVYKDFFKEYKQGSLISTILHIKLNDQILRVIQREVQIDPVTDNPIHIDFQLIKEDVPIKVAVRVRVINKDCSPGIKKGGILNIIKKYIVLNGMPHTIPQYLEVDISGFEIGTNIHINDIALPKGIVSLDQDNFTVLTIAGRVEEEVVASDVVSEDKEQKPK